MSEEDARKIIDKIKQEEFPYALAIAKAYEKLEEENKKLKEKLEENTKIYLHTSKYASKMEGKYVELNYILTEIEKWLEEKIKLTKLSLIEIITFKRCLEELQELKEGKK